MINKIVVKTIEVSSRFYRFIKRAKFDFLLNKGLIKEDLDFLNKDQKNQAKEYWKKYTNKYNVKYCSYYSSRRGLFDQHYIPDSLYYTYIDSHFNNKEKSFGIDDQNYYSKLLPNLKQPQTVLRKINGYYYDSEFTLKKPQEIMGLFLKEKKYILKPSLSSQSKGGRDIVFIDDLEAENLKDLLFTLDHYIVQELVKQHSSLSELHPSSVNTIRVVSLFLKGEIHILSTVLRIGMSGSKVDAGGGGGLTLGIDERGRLKSRAYSLLDRRIFETHPDTGVVFQGYQIPAYEAVLAIVKEEAIKLPDFRMIAWDFAIDERGQAVFIEFNLRYGQLDFHQFTNGPLFGDLTDEVLEEVFLQ